MKLYGIGVGPGDPQLLTIRGKRVLEQVDTVFIPGDLAQTIISGYVSASNIVEIQFPMTTDKDKLQKAWQTAADHVVEKTDDKAAFVTIGDPSIYSTFGHLRRALRNNHSTIDIEVIPGVSAATAFASAFDVDVVSGTNLMLAEAPNGTAPTGPDQMVLLKITDVPTTHSKLTEAGYDVWYGRRLFMEDESTVITQNPDDLEDRDYFTLGYARHQDIRVPSIGGGENNGT